MEIQLIIPFNLITLLILPSLIFLVMKALMKPKTSTKNEKLPPSPPKLPVIGHLHHIVGRGLAHHALRRVAQKYGPVLHLKLGQVSTVLISSAEAAKQVLKDQDPGCAGRPESIAFQIMWYDYTDIAFSLYNEYWRQMRRICVVELLSAKNVNN